MRRSRLSTTGLMNLDSLVDIVSNNVGILIILAAFMALSALVHPLTSREERRATPRERPPKKLLVPWSHPTNKHMVFFAVRENRLQHLDLRPYYLELAGREPGRRPEPVAIEKDGLTVRFYPVTNQVYCMEFQPERGAGENWLRAQRADSRWRRALRRFPPERYIYFFWVTGDSFELFREIRDHLWQENYEVGWKPLPDDAPMEVCNGFEGSTAFQPQ